MLKPSVEKLLCEQITKEMYSAQLYMSMAAYLNDQSLNGYSKWYYIQTMEERDHASILYHYVLRTGGKVTFEAIGAPPNDFDSLDEVLSKTYEHEQFVTQSIYDIVEEAQNQKDFKTVQFLQWFVEEQVEEEDEASNNLGRFRALGNDSQGLYMLDADMGARVYNKTALLVSMEAE